MRPAHGGRCDTERVTYAAADGERVIIKGSERITSWQKVEGNVWKTILNNSFFGDYNPYQEKLGGDWFIFPEDITLHTGDVYMNGKSFYEAGSLEEVKNPTRRTHGFNPPWTKHPEPLLHQMTAFTSGMLRLIMSTLRFMPISREKTRTRS